MSIVNYERILFQEDEPNSFILPWELIFPDGWLACLWPLDPKLSISLLIDCFKELIISEFPRGGIRCHLHLSHILSSLLHESLL